MPPKVESSWRLSSPSSCGSGGKSMMRRMVPPRGGRMPWCFSVESGTAIFAGVCSVRHTFTARYPGRAATLRMEVAGASSTMRELPFASSAVTMRRIGGKWSFTEARSQDLARDSQPRLAHIVAAQLAQRVARELGGDVLAPVEIEVGVVHGLRARGDELRRLVDHLVAELFSLQERAGLFDQERPRGHGAQRNPDISCRINGSGDAQHRKIEGAAAPQLPVAARLVLRNAHLGQDLVGPALEVIDAVVVVEVFQRHLALAERGNQLHLRPERHQRRRAIGGGHGDAALAGRRDPADVAVLLQAEVDRLAPLVILVVV